MEQETWLMGYLDESGVGCPGRGVGRADAEFGKGVWGQGQRCQREVLQGACPLLVRSSQEDCASSLMCSEG